MQHNACADCGKAVGRRSIRCRSCAVRQGWHGTCDACGSATSGQRSRLCGPCAVVEESTPKSSCADCGQAILSRGSVRCRSCVGKATVHHLTRGRRTPRRPRTVLVTLPPAANEATPAPVMVRIPAAPGARPLLPNAVRTLAMEHLEPVEMLDDGTFTARCTQCGHLWTFDRAEEGRPWCCDVCDRAAVARYRTAA